MRARWGRHSPNKFKISLMREGDKLFAKEVIITKTGWKNFLNLVMDVYHRTWYAMVLY